MANAQQIFGASYEPGYHGGVAPSNFASVGMAPAQPFTPGAVKNPMVTPRQRYLPGVGLQTYYPNGHGQGSVSNSADYLPGLSTPSDSLDTSKMLPGMDKQKFMDWNPGTYGGAAPGGPPPSAGPTPPVSSGSGTGNAVSDPNGAALLNSLLGGGGFQWGLDDLAAQKSQNNNLLTMLGY